MSPVNETIKLVNNLLDLGRAKTEDEALLHMQACRFLTAFYRNQEVVLGVDTERILGEHPPTEEDDSSRSAQTQTD